MNFLELAKAVRSECGISGSGPSSVLNQTGEMGRIVEWTSSAWEDIQMLRDDWWFRRKSFAPFTTVALQQAYPQGSIVPDVGGQPEFGSWMTKTLRIYRTSAGVADEQRLEYWDDYDDFRDTYMYGVRSPTRPSGFAIRPNDQALLLGEVPDALGYTIYGDYIQAARRLSQNGDVPSIPREFHMLIVYRAMMKYADYEEAAAVLTRAKAKYDEMLRALVKRQTGGSKFGAPLA